MKLLPEDSLELLEGRSFLIDVLDTGGRACFTYRGGLFRPLFSAARRRPISRSAPISRPSCNWWPARKIPDTLFFNRELSIEGDTELGLVVKNMLDAVEWPQLPKLPVFSH